MSNIWNDVIGDDDEFDEDYDDIFEDEDDDDEAWPNESFDDEDGPEYDDLVVVSAKLTASDEGASLTLGLDDGDLVQVTDDDHRFAAIVAAVASNDFAEVTRLWNGGATRGEQAVHEVIEERFARLSERVTIEGTEVFFDGRPVHSIVSQTVLRYVNEGRDASGLVRFMERISSNPSKHAYDQAWSWIERQGLIVDEDGMVHGYKAIANDGLSSHGGKDPVYIDQDGHRETVVGRVPNRVGSVISMDRRNVDDDSSKDCSYGLHVGTYAYASTFAPVLTEVKFDPADIVSVPDYDTNKVRVCRYEVLDVHMPEIGDDLGKYEAPGAEQEAIATDQDDLVGALDDLVAIGEATPERVSLIKRALGLVKGLRSN